MLTTWARVSCTEAQRSALALTPQRQATTCRRAEHSRAAQRRCGCTRAPVQQRTQLERHVSSRRRRQRRAGACRRVRSAAATERVAALHASASNPALHWSSKQATRLLTASRSCHQLERAAGSRARQAHCQRSCLGGAAALRLSRRPPAPVPRRAAHLRRPPAHHTARRGARERKSATVVCCFPRGTAPAGVPPAPRTRASLRPPCVPSASPLRPARAPRRPSRLCAGARRSQTKSSCEGAHLQRCLTRRPRSAAPAACPLACVRFPAAVAVRQFCLWVRGLASGAACASRS